VGSYQLYSSNGYTYARTHTRLHAHTITHSLLHTHTHIHTHMHKHAPRAPTRTMSNQTALSIKLNSCIFYRPRDACNYVPLSHKCVGKFATVMYITFLQMLLTGRTQTQSLDNVMDRSNRTRLEKSQSSETPTICMQGLRCRV